MKKIHITQIIPTLNFGGAERTVVDIINSCDPERFTFSVLTFFDELPLAQELKRSDVTIRVVYKKPYETLGLMRRIRDQLRELRPDVVHTHLFGADVWGKRAAHQLHLPVVSTEHNLNYQENILKHGIKRFLCPPSDRYVATSEAIKVYMKQKYGVQKPIEVIRCGIDLKRFNDRPLDTSFPLQHLLIVGRLTRQKGHAVALRALQQLVEFP
jgi:glycosyltransferase involved in cell wall biosynthesis